MGLLKSNVLSLPFEVKLLLCAVFLALARAENLFSISLAWHKTGLETLLQNNIHHKYLSKLLKPNLNSGSAKNDSVQLFKFLQSNFYGEILLGSPGHVFKVVFDTTTPNTWVPSVMCSPFAYPACALRNKYDSTKSSTYIEDGTPYTIMTDKGTLSGFLSIDKLHLGHLNVMNQTFVEVEEMSLLQLLYSGFDGTVGMSFDTDPNDNFLTFFDNLILQNKMMKRIFSFYINRQKETEKGGTLFLGGSNKSHYNGSFTYLAVTNNFTWEFKMDKIQVNIKLPSSNRTFEVCSKGCKASPSSADVSIYGPKDDIKKINRLLTAHYVPFLRRYEISCDKIHKLPQVTFVLAGKNFVLRGTDYVQQVMYGPTTLCLSAFTEIGGGLSVWVLGTSFMGRYYTEFNAEKFTVGFAPAV